MGDALFATFGTPDFAMARNAYKRSVVKFGYEALLFNLDSEPLRQARKDNPGIFGYRRGYGYWFWKPYVIEEALKCSDPGGIVFYTDLGVRMEYSPERLLDHVRGHDIVTFRVGSGFPQRYYTKRDCFVLMEADGPRYWDDEQSNGAYFIVRNCEAGRKFVSEWKSYMIDARILTDVANTQGLPNLHGFVDHRHDQSILSILATRHKIPMLRDPSQFGNGKISDGIKASERFDPYDFGQIFHHHRQRDGQYTGVG